MQSKVKICIIGPSYPFRGGISHHTTLLFRVLKKKYTVRFFAFKRQYPKWLFPGKTDKDISNIALKESETENMLDSLNPWTWLNVAWKIRHENPNLVIFPWWSSFWIPQFWTIATIIKIFSNIKILFLCHNVIEHESNGFSKMCTKWVLKKANFFIVHSEEEKGNLLRMFPYAKVKQSFHPTYGIFNYRNFDSQEERRRLGLKSNVILFFGFIRKYKGLKYLIKAMPQILKNIHVTLLIVGEFWDDKEEYLKLIRKLKIENWVKIIDKYVPNEEIGRYFNAADLIVQPYISATGSGVIQLAYGFNKPVIATKVGCLSEVVQEGKTGYLVESASIEPLAKAIVKFFREDKTKDFSKYIKNENKKFSWDRIVEAIEALTGINNL